MLEFQGAQPHSHPYTATEQTTEAAKEVGRSVDDRGFGLTAGIIVLCIFIAITILVTRYFYGRIKSIEEEEKAKRDTKRRLEIEAEFHMLADAQILNSHTAEDSELATSRKIHPSIKALVSKPYGLENHTFFHKMKHYITVMIPTLPIDEPLRRAIFRDYLRIKFHCISKAFELFIKAGDIDLIPHQVFQSKLQSLVIDARAETDERAKLKEIPEVVLDKFNQWNVPVTTSFEAFVTDICNSPWYQTNTMKLVAVLDFSNTVLLHFTLINAHKALASLNGELDKVTYHGLISEKAQHILDEEALKKKPKKAYHKGATDAS